MSPAEIRKQRQNFIRNLKNGNNVNRAKTFALFEIAAQLAETNIHLNEIVMHLSALNDRPVYAMGEYGGLIVEPRS